MKKRKKDMRIKIKEILWKIRLKTFSINIKIQITIMEIESSVAFNLNFLHKLIKMIFQKILIWIQKREKQWKKHWTN